MWHSFTSFLQFFSCPVLSARFLSSLLVSSSLLSGPARTLLTGWQVPVLAHLALQPLWCLIHEDADLWTLQLIWRGFGGAGHVCVVCVWVCVHRKAQSPHHHTALPCKSSTYWMLNKPVCWIIEDLRPERTAISIQALWTQSALWHHGLPLDSPYQLNALIFFLNMLLACCQDHLTCQSHF